MKSIIDWLFSNQTKGSRELAANRMKIMVTHDRQQMPPVLIEKMKQELLQVMSRYFSIDPENAECVIESRGGRSAFIMTNVPLVKKGEKRGDDNYLQRSKKRKNRFGPRDFSTTLS